ncbi:MAG: hypothetical protein M1445_14790 [Bacteroidetes bacterium]|nr:hypothetical protein [Bacteroidota bacterium]MCL6103931.1 hypothetical protein [Bacteroidota bacterium]
MTILRFNHRTKKGKSFFELLKKAEDKGYISIEKIDNWRSSKTALEKKHGKAIIIKDLDRAIKVCEELLNNEK